MSQAQAIDAGIEAIEILSRNIGTAQRLADLGVQQDKMP